MFQGAAVVFAYSRAQAIEDGVLVDLTERARGLFQQSPSIVATSAVWADCLSKRDDEPPLREGTRIDVLLTKVHECLFTLQPDSVQWVTASNERGEEVRLQVHGGGGDEGEFVVTVMMEGED